VALAQPLQQVATRASSYALVTLGLPAIAEGSVIILNDVEIGVVGACSGLRMLVVFFAIATGVALLIRRAWWERLVLVASAIPIAIAANVARIVVTGLLYQVVSNEAASRFFHDLAGWFMIPLALTMVWAELRVLSRLWVPDPAGDGGVVGLGLKPGEPADEAAAFAAARS
jgi:exosortase